jgi:hypothetical protein
MAQAALSLGENGGKHQVGSGSEAEHVATGQELLLAQGLAYRHLAGGESAIWVVRHETSGVGVM